MNRPNMANHEELLMSLPAPEERRDSPTIEPLPIAKPQSPVAVPGRPGNGFASGPPSARSARSPASESKSSLPPLPNFPRGPGASSCPAPFPYPEDDVNKHRASNASRPRRLASAIETQDASGPCEYKITSPRLNRSPAEQTGLSKRRGMTPRPLQNSTLSRIDSVSTTKASRGSPPPPETPDFEPGRLPPLPGGDMQARCAASGSSGTATLASFQSATQPSEAQSGGPAATRPWTPTETPDQQPHGPPTVYLGSAPVSSAGAHQDGQVGVRENNLRRLQASTPPPAYTSVNAWNSKEKQRQQTSASATGPSEAAAGLASAGLQHPSHPAFANANEETKTDGQTLAHTASLLASAASPPPLPEGWIAHLDQNSGQYYYIHLATQATQWDFPKGPTPMHHETAPLSPTCSTYGRALSPFATQVSPMFALQTPGYAESIMSVAASAGFTGPPPSAGVDMYRIAPANGVYFGPYLRYANMDLERGVWVGSIMLVTETPQRPTIHLHASSDLSPHPRQLKAEQIAHHQGWVFYKYHVDIQMAETGSERWTYAVTSHLGCTRYEFVVAGRNELGWRVLAHSGNDFAPSTSQSERAKLGGVGYMWKDVLHKNADVGGFHVQLGLGCQICGDRLWKEVPLLRQWLAIQGRENRRNAAWTARHHEAVAHAYFHYYSSHFDQSFLREAFAQIPHVLQIDDHDIFDGYGSYPDYMQSSPMFKGVGRIAIDMYLLFQHHTAADKLRDASSDFDLFTITGTGWHFVKYLGPAVVVVGPDCRSERTMTRVMDGPSYQGLFPKVARLPPSVQHCIWMLSVPVIYPRLEAVETLANTFASGKKAVNTTYNMLGKVTSSVAGVVGGREVVQHGFTQVKKAIGKGGLMGSVLNQFGDFDIAEELRDLWTHRSKDMERTYLIRTLQGIAHQKGIRMTFLSGDLNTCGAGLVHDPTHPNDHKTMYQVIASPIVAAPGGHYLLKLLHNNKLLYVPANGFRSTHEVSDTKEDMMEIFHTEPSGQPREHKKLMGRRNYVAIVAYDPVGGVKNGMGAGNGSEGSVGGSAYAGSVYSGQGGGGGGVPGMKLSLAVDFIVQGDDGLTQPTKYGPLIVPHLEFGH